MNRYDKEINIIKDFQKMHNYEIALMSKNLKTISVLNSIHSKRKWKKWIDSSSKNDLPPDFYNPSLKLMMDVMRVDDHTHIDENGKVVNPHNKRESELLEEMFNINQSLRTAAEKGYVFIIPKTDLPTDKDHNYNFYKDCFERVVNKHINKIKKYKENHPEFKTVFFVVDESSPYIKCLDKKSTRVVGECVHAQPHFWWLDKNMLLCFADSDVDYLIWMTPYKHFDSKEKVTLPEAIIFDIKKIKYDKLVEYVPSEMESLEL